MPRNSQRRVKRILNNSVLYGKIQRGWSFELEWTADEKCRQRGLREVAAPDKRLKSEKSHSGVL